MLTNDKKADVIKFLMGNRFIPYFLDTRLAPQLGFRTEINKKYSPKFSVWNLRSTENKLNCDLILDKIEICRCASLWTFLYHPWCNVFYTPNNGNVGFCAETKVFLNKLYFPLNFKTIEIFRHRYIIYRAKRRGYQFQGSITIIYS